MAAPVTNGAKPRQTVSTSGNSGIPFSHACLDITVLNNHHGASNPDLFVLIYDDNLKKHKNCTMLNPVKDIHATQQSELNKGVQTP
jgi:hypothetical protein